MNHCFILNPAAGQTERVEELSRKIEQTCEARGVTYELYRTACVRDATEYVKRRVALSPSEDYRFYACGGDGTLCEVVEGVMNAETGGERSVGLIPSGTGNDFVRNFTGRELFFDIDAQLEGETEAVDLIRCNDRYAINMINVGFDCEVVVKTAQLKRKKWIPGGMAYIAGLVLTLLRKPGVRCQQSLGGGEAAQKRYLLNTYANGCFCGGGFYSNPRSDLTDGKIDALLVNNVGRLKFLTLVGHYKKGTHLVPKFERILRNVKADRADLYFEGGANVSVDGEVIRVEELHLSVVPRALNFVIPAGAALRKPAEEKKPQMAAAAT